MLGPIETGLARPWYCLRLPDDLEARFIAQGSIGSARRIRSWLFVFILFNVLSLRLDFDRFGEEAFIVPAVLTLGLVVPVTLIAIVLLRGDPSPKLQMLSVLTTSIVTMSVTLNSARMMSGPNGDTYLILAAIIPLVVGMIAPMTFRYSLIYCGTCFAIYVGAVAGFSLDQADGFGVPLLVASLVLVPLKLSYSREWETKQGFLLGLKEQIHTAALARDNDRLTNLSETDALTGVANRRAFDVRFDAAWMGATSSRSWLGLALIDIDHFKALNDSAGHEAGDRCLQAVAQALSTTAARQGGVVARYGGEEFAALFPGYDPERTVQAAEALYQAVQSLRYAHPGLPSPRHVSVCVGATCAHGATAHHGVTVESLLRSADAALYQAKRDGRDRVEVAAALPSVDRTEIRRTAAA